RGGRGPAHRARRAGRGGSAGHGRLRPRPRRVAPRPRRPGRGRPARGGAQLAAARAAPGRHEPRGSLHPCRGGRAGERGLMRWVPVFKKEMRLYFGSPVAYAFLALFLLIAGWVFSEVFLVYG